MHYIRQSRSGRLVATTHAEANSSHRLVVISQCNTVNLNRKAPADTHGLHGTPVAHLSSSAACGWQRHHPPCLRHCTPTTHTSC
jgi:hypothetical protein